MEQENTLSDITLPQNSDTQQPSQNVFQQNSPSLEPTDMMIENGDSEDFSRTSLPELLKICQFKKALSLLNSELDSKQASFGEFDVKLVPVLNQMAEVQIALAQYAKASALCQRSEQILQNYQEDPDYNSLMAQTCQYMALISREDNNKKEALDLINKSMALSPSDNLQNIEIHRIKALILCDFQQYKEALQEIQKSLDIIDKSANTVDSILQVRVYNTLGEIRSTYYDWYQAKMAYEIALKICGEHGLIFHVEMAKACEGFGYSLIGIKKSSNLVLKLARSALGVYKDCFGEDRHPARISCYLLFAKFFKSLEPSYPPNLKIYIMMAVEEAEAFYGSDCEKTIEIRISVAKMTGNRQDKQELVKSILEISTENKSGRELGNLVIQKCEAALLCKDLDFFESFFPEAVNTIKGIYGDMSLEVANVYEKILIFYQMKGQLQKMPPFIIQYRKIYQEIFGEDHIEIAKACIMIAKICITFKDEYSAILYLEQALKIQAGFYVEVHPAMIETLTLLTTSYWNIEEPLKCLKTYFKILKIRENLEDEKIYETYEEIGIIYTKMNDEKNAERYFRKSYQMARVNFGMEDPRTEHTRQCNYFGAREKDMIYDNQGENIL